LALRTTTLHVMAALVAAIHVFLGAAKRRGRPEQVRP
jgi:hypothetical protein